MKFPLIALIFSGGIASATTVVSHAWNVSATVPDNSIVGWSDTRSISSPTIGIVDVQVHLEIFGGFNGDLYAYITHETGFSVLLNRVGRTAGNPDGSWTTGMNVTFSQAAGQDVHIATGFSGTYQPDGRTASPLTVTNSSPRTAMLTSFNGLDPNGEWTLFVADLSPIQQSTVLGWGLIITTSDTAIPEPGPFLGTGVLLLLAMLRRRR